MNVVYFAEHANGDIKIGTTRFDRLSGRWSELEFVYGRLELRGYIEGGREKEIELHAHFAEHQRIKQREDLTTCKTEFFAPVATLLQYIDKHCRKDYEVKRTEKHLAVNSKRVAEMVIQKFGEDSRRIQKQISEETGLTVGTVSWWMLGHTRTARPATVERWCLFLNCQPEDILEFTEDTP